MKGELIKNDKVVGMYRINGNVINATCVDDLGVTHILDFDTLKGLDTWADFYGMEVC